jgi:glycosyltransferase involved in cell wall biosynthesis
MRACTVTRGAGVAATRVLAASLARVYPDRRLIVLVGPSGARYLRDGEPFDVIQPRDLAEPALEETAAAAPREPLEALLRALLVRHLHATGEAVLLLPADAEVLAPLTTLEAAVAGQSAVLVPRLLGRLPDDGKRPDGADLLRAGEIDDELVAVAPGDRGRAFVDWWVDRGYEAIEASGAGPAAGGPPASPLGAARRVFEGIALLEDPGYDVSYWNLHERPLERRGEALLAAGRPLALLRLVGFRPDRPWWLSDRGSRTLVVDDPVLEEVCGRRAAAMRDAGWTSAEERAAHRHELLPGIVLDERLERLHAEALDAGESFGDLGRQSAVDAFLSWLREPAPQGGAAGINRYSHDVWRRRRDVQEAYPDLDREDADGFIGWLWVHGRSELGLQGPLLPPPPAWVEHVMREAPAVAVVGYLRGNLGLGEAARGYVRAMQAAGVPVATHTVLADPPVDERERAAMRRPETRAFDDLQLEDGRRPDVNLLCVNADQLPALVAELGSTAATGRYTIGQWAWETDAIPDRWSAAFNLVDEIWVYSRYVAENVSRASPVPVVVVPLPVEAPPAPGRSTLPVPLAEEDFAFLFAFDYFSTLERKNPVGLVEAFTRAFAPGEGPKLVLKTIHAGFRPEARERLRWTARGRPDVLLVDALLAPDEMAALFARADCYVSLHRSEGFGLTLAESMALGKPVVATAFGGNTDFMTPANSYLVDWSPTAVGPEGEHYPAEGTWAEPSVEHAAALMREVWEDRDGARRRGARAADDVAQTLSAEAVGGIARHRLERIAAAWGDRAPAPPWPLDQLDDRIAFDLAGRSGHGGLRGFARRGVLRMMRPYTSAERRLDEAMVGALRRLQIELEAERAARARDRDRLARLERRMAELAGRRSTPPAS